MMRLLKGCGTKVAALVCGLMLAGLTGAAQGSVQYSVTDLGPNGDGMELWQYDYTVVNSTAVPVKEFTIFFSYSYFTTYLVNNSLASGWSTEVSPPVPASYSDGLLIGVAATPLAVNDRATGFSVFAVSPPPAIEQNYELRNSEGNVVESGLTTAVPEPTTWALLGIALGVVAVARRKLVSGAAT